MNQPTTTNPTDAELLRRHLGGDMSAFAALVKRYQNSLYAFLVRFTGNKTTAEDIFQETFLKVHQVAAMIDPDKNFRSWLFTVAANKARDQLRKQRRHPEMPLDATVSAHSDEKTSFAELLPGKILAPDEISMNHETRQAVQQIIAEMPDRLREVLALSYLKEMSHKEIAEVLDIPVGTVKSRLHAAVRRFAEVWRQWAAEQDTQVSGN